MERCGFFDANLVGEEYDRTYLAEQFASYFASFIGNGVFGGKSSELQITAMPDPSMQIAALSGQAWINGYWYENTDDLYLPIEVADGVLDRIDSVVLRLGFAERNMWLTVKKGASSVNPSAPELVRNADYYELQIATVYVKAGALNIKQMDITDTRPNTDVCGFVVGLIKQFDTTDFGRQLDSFINEFEADNLAKMNEVLAKLNTVAENNNVASIILDLDALQRAAFIAHTDKSGSDALNASTNFDDIREPGIYWCNTWEGGTLNATAPNKRDTGWMVVHSNSTKCMVQTYYSGTGIIKNRAKDEETDNFGEWEFVNPPMVPGVEYRTVERWNGKPVYAITIHAASLPNKSLLMIDTNVTMGKIVSIDGFATNSNNDHFPFPVIQNTGVVPTAGISNVVASEGFFVVYTSTDMTSYQAYFTIKYTK